ncbi:MAG: chemotaxis protein CheC [Candidatus Hydrothermarchaeales archaeon]
MDSGEEIDGLTVDALKEISNIATGHLSEVICQLTKKTMSMSVPEAKIVKVNDATEKIGGKGATILVGYLSVLGDVMGSVVVSFNKKDAVKLTELTLNEEVNPVLFPSPLEKDALREFITIMGSAYLNAITQFLGIYLIPSSPIISLFGGFNLLNFLKIREGHIEEYETRNIVAVSIKYAVEGSDVKGEILILVSPTILDYLMKKIKEKHG